MSSAIEANCAGDVQVLRCPRVQESWYPSDQYTRGLEAMTNASLKGITITDVWRRMSWQHGE